MFENAEAVHRLLMNLSEAMELEEAPPVSLVVCGGAALQVLNFISRATRDIDVVAIVQGGKDISPEPLPAELEKSVERVAREHDLPMDWLNTGPAGNQELGLPHGLLERSLRHKYSSTLEVFFLSRLDQIHFKLYAMVEQGGPGKHMSDLQSLEPSIEELHQAAIWSMTHDPSIGYKQVLCGALRALDAGKVADDIESQ